MEKPFLLFAGAHYYPGGGWHDFHDAFGTEAEARAWLQAADVEWGQIVDVRTHTIVHAVERPIDPPDLIRLVKPHQ
jgi:hypothetical protein